MLAILRGQHEAPAGSVPAQPRAIGCEGAGGWLIASQQRQLTFSRTVLDHLPAPRLALEALGHVLAQLPDRTADTWGRHRGGIDDALAGKVVRQWRRAGLRVPPDRVLCSEAGAMISAAVSSSAALSSKIGELQLELLDEPGPALGRAAVLLAALPWRAAA
jgi:hypothetical protein